MGIQKLKLSSESALNRLDNKGPIKFLVKNKSIYV